MSSLDSKPLSPQQIELMEKLHIRHSLVDNFHYRDYRYTSLDDAIAQASRDQTKQHG
jgi:hypothetical protein